VGGGGPAGDRGGGVGAGAGAGGGGREGVNIGAGGGGGGGRGGADRVVTRGVIESIYINLPSTVLS
jgi:hypothetical protein